MKHYKFTILLLIFFLTATGVPCFGQDGIGVVVSQGTCWEPSYYGMSQLIYDTENISVSGDGVYAIMIGSHVSNVMLDPPNNWQARLADIVWDPGSGWVAEARGSDAVLFRNLSGEWLNYTYGYVYWTHDGFINGPDPIQIAEIVSSFAVSNELIPEEAPYIFTDFQIEIGPQAPYSPTGNGSVIVACQGNCDDDTDMDGTDLALFSTQYANNSPEADLNNDLAVDEKDVFLVALTFGRPTCP